jgi:CRP-like cAMP-binding protein
MQRTGLFEGLSVQHREEARGAFGEFHLGAGEELMVEGEEDRSMVAVVEGRGSARLGGAELGAIGEGELVGEMALFGSLGRRSATVVTVTEMRLLTLDEDGLKHLRLRDNPVALLLETRVLRQIGARLRAVDAAIAELAAGEDLPPERHPGMFGRVASALGLGPRAAPAPAPVEVLLRTPGFGVKDEGLLRTLARRMEVVAVDQDEVLLREGDPGEDAFIVARGRVVVLRGTVGGRQERVAQLGPGHIVGAVGLTDAGVRTATVRAMTPAHLLRIPGEVYRELEVSPSQEARVFRRGLIDALAAQLRLANEHLVRQS